METDDVLRKNSRRDARQQLTRRIGLGYAWPINTTVVETQHTSADPEDTNTPERIYSKVSFEQQEHIYLRQPQAGVRYWLVDEERVTWEAPPPELLESLRVQLKALKDQPGYQAQTPDYRHSALQPNLTLTTPAISNRDRNFVVVAEDLQRSLITVLQTRITVKAGVDVNLAVAARPTPASESESSYLPKDALVILDYQARLDVRITTAQAECLYRLAEVEKAEPVPEEADAATPDGYAFRSAADSVGGEPRNAHLTSVPFAENTRLQVYAQFVNTVNFGYLLQQIPVMVRPNRGLALVAELSDTATKANAPDAPLVENPQNHPHTVYYQGTAGLTVQGTQTSAAYRAKLVSIDIAPNAQVTGSSAVDDLQPHLGKAWSAVVEGNGSDTLLPLSVPLTEDATLAVEALDRQYGTWPEAAMEYPVPHNENVPVVLDQTLHFHVYPDPSPTVVSPAEPVPAGSHVQVEIHQSQEGVSYQLYRADTDEPLGEPQYHSKNKTLEHFIIGVDFSPNSFEGHIVKLVVPSVTEDLELYVKATKPLSQLSLRLPETATIQVAT